MQAIRGHSDLMSRRRPVDEVIADEQAPAALKEKLTLVSDARAFATDELLLPDNDSYRSYADLERDYVVWNVFAAPEFSLQPETWCYPVAGCVAYRGYFSEDAARKRADKLKDKGLDVAMGGVAAYSTLGRFDDPVLNTMMRWSDVDLVATIFHELAHQRLYVKDDSAFNESFATAVADIGVDRWLNVTGEPDRLAIYRQHKALRLEVQALVRATRTELESLYASNADDDTKRAAKREILDRLSADAQALIDADGRGLRNWLAPPLNNARLVSMNLYEGQVDVFRAIYEKCDRSLACFYARAAELGDMSFETRNRVMRAAAD
jgi:predicted aminopeptidase